MRVSLYPYDNFHPSNFSSIYHVTKFTVHGLQYLPATAHDSFAFREMAYAVLSLATGKLYFDESSTYIGECTSEESTGFLVDFGRRGRTYPDADIWLRMPYSISTTRFNSF